MARGEIHIQLAVNFSKDPKVRALARYGRDSRGCRDLYVQMLCYCKENLTDGFVPLEEIGVLVYPDSPKAGKRDADRLVEIGLAEVVEGGYRLPGFLKRNKSKAQVDAESAVKAANGRKGGKRSGEVRRGEANAKHPASADEAEAKQGASGGLNAEVIGHRSETEGFPPYPPNDADDWSEAEVQTSPSASADAHGDDPDDPGADLVLIRVEESKPKRKSRARKADRTENDDLADGLTNGYWERYAKTTAKKWIAVRQIVLTALDNGNERDDIAFALDLLGREGKPVTSNTLSFAITHVRAQRQQSGAPSTAVDRRQQATNDLFERAMQRAAAREEAS